MKPRMFVLSSFVLVVVLLGASHIHPMLAQAPSISPAPAPDSLVFSFKIPPLEITQDSDGLAWPSIEGFDVSGTPGDPVLPIKAYHIALPLDVVWESVKVEVVQAEMTELAGMYTIAPAPPGTTWEEDRQIILWGKNDDTIVEDKNAQVYQNDAYFPSSQLSVAGHDQMRKWRVLNLIATPVQYNPVTGKLRQATEIQIQVTFDRAPSVDEWQLQLELSDTTMDAQAAQLLVNYDQAQSWYPVTARPEGASATADYVIITTKAIVAASTMLNSFIAHKQDQGYAVLVVTEDQYGGLTGQWPNRMAEKIRQWLINNYQLLSIQYVLLIGDPTPYDPDHPAAAVGDVPMKMCWPAHRYLDEHGNPLGQNIPTDYLYADLTGNWNLNTHGQLDEYCGELTDDDGAGGMNFFPEVYVGRIPVYSIVGGWVSTLDSILDKTITYEDSGDMAWRKRALLPMTFADSSTDGAYLARAMQNDYLNAAGYSSYTLYQYTGYHCYSSFASDQNLVNLAVRDHWKNRDYGLVTWWAHGWYTSASIGYGSCGSGNVFTSWNASVLDDSRPAIVFQVSCENGHPEDTNNLGYALLKNGAVATFSSSRNSIYYSGHFAPSRPGADNASIGYYVMQRIVNGQKAAVALYDEKSQMSALGNWDTNKVGNWIDFNLYGDPTVSINDGLPWPPNPPSGLTATSTALGGIHLAWTDASANETGFVIERTTNPSIAWMQIGIVGINTTSFSDSDLTCGHHYYYRLHAFNMYGSSSNSNVADTWSVIWDDYEVDDTYPNAKSIIPTGAGASGQTHTFHIAGDVDWAKFQTIAGKTYTITTSSLGANSDTVLELYDTTGLGQLATNDNCAVGSPASCIKNWVAPTNGVYYIKVYHAQNAGGCSGYEYNLAVQAGGVANWPAQPTNLTAMPVSFCQINLAWTDNSTNEDGFEIERWGWYGAGSGGIGMVKWQQIAQVGPNVTSYSDTGLTCNTLYPYRVRAYNANGKSFYSGVPKATTLSYDAFESDGSYASAKSITVNGTPQAHNFHIPGDEDWVKFSVVAGRVYTITTSNLGDANDTVLELYAQNGTTRLEWSDDCNGPASCIKKWTAPTSGIYYVRVYNYYGHGGCPGYQYTLTVTGTSSGTSLLAPSGLWVWDKSVSTIYMAWPDTISVDHGFRVERQHWFTSTLGQWQVIGIAGPGRLSIAGPGKMGITQPNDGVASFNDIDLTCNTVYTYRVCAFDALGDSAYSDIFTATTSQWDTFEPDDVYTQAVTVYVNGGPQNHNLGPDTDYDWGKFTATAREAYTITASGFTNTGVNTPTLELFGDQPWSHPITSTQRCGDDEGALCLNGWSSSISGTVYLRMHGLGGCPGYDYKLTVVDSYVGSTLPAPPTGFTGTLALPDRIDLTWIDNSDNELGFRLERHLGLGWLQVADMGYGVTSYSDADLPCGQPNEYRVYAYNANGQSTYTTLNIATPACIYPVATPTGLTATAGLPIQIVLAWVDNSDNESGFKIERSLSSTSNWMQVYTTVASITAYTDTWLMPDTLYDYRIRGYNVTGDFDYSNVASARTGHQIYLPIVLRAW